MQINKYFSPKLVTAPFSSIFLLALAICIVPLENIQANTDKPLKVFILVGQSNMQGHARNYTLEHIGMDPKTAPLLEDLQKTKNSAKVFSDIRVAYLSDNGVKKGPLTTGFGADENKFGPELSFGMTIDKVLKEPALIIKAAWGGKSLFSDFRPPSAGIYGNNAEESGHYYRLTVQHIKEVLGNLAKYCPGYSKKQGTKLCGLVWFQGWNDMVNGGVYPNRDRPGGYDEYSTLMAQFIRDIRKDLSAPKLPFVIGVMGTGGPTNAYTGDQKRYANIHQNFRDAMAAPAKLPEFKDNVRAVFTENYWDEELTKLSERDKKISQEVKKIQSAKNIKGKKVEELRNDLRKKEFSDLELEKLQKGISNMQFHYFGSGKVMAGIGVGFAEAVLDLQQDQNN